MLVSVCKDTILFSIIDKKMVSRAFDSFDCSTDDCTAQIVRSRKPVERLSIPIRISRLLSLKTLSATAKIAQKRLGHAFDSFDWYFTNDYPHIGDYLKKVPDGKK